jgi:hypothetical protein
MVPPIEVIDSCAAPSWNSQSSSAPPSAWNSPVSGMARMLPLST